MHFLKDILQINNAVLEYFQKALYKNAAALKYLKKRLPQETIEEFKLGYAPENGFLHFLERNNIDFDIAEQIGLVGFDFDKKFEKVYRPIFSRRIMIPIYHGRRLVGFGGRILGKSSNIKYLNSKNSFLYQKGSVLYGLDQTRKHIYKKGYAILVEGYFDVLGLYAAGVRNCCAVCGSGLTKQQVQTIKRYTSNVLTLFDGDAAGRKAGQRAKEKLKEEGIFSGTVFLKKGYDPDTFVREFGKKALRTLPRVR